MRKVRTLAVVQARLGSTRYPRKVLSDLAGSPSIEVLLNRLSRSRLVDEVVVAIPDGSADDELHNVISRLGVRVFRGSESDVLSRFEGAIAGSSADLVARLTGDCPLVDPTIVDSLIELVVKSGAD